MKRKKEQAFVFFVSTFIIVLNVVSFFLIWFYVLEQGSLKSLDYATHRILLFIYVIVFIYLSNVFDGFAFNRRRITENIYSLSLASFLSLCLFYFLETLAFRLIRSPLYLLLSLICSIIINILFCIYANRRIFSNYKKKKTIIYYKDDDDLIRVKQLTYFDIKYEILDTVKNPQSDDINLECDAVFISGIETNIRNVIIKKYVENKKEIFIFPSVSDVVVSGGKYVEEFFFPMVRLSRSNRDVVYLFMKRFFDIVFSLIALIVLSPLMIITALIIKLYDGGPVFYKQNRLTINGKVFTIYKFRSMKQDAENDGVARLVSKNDNRITPVGKVIRSIRFDELPQLLNILKGDMSIVGPRPERPEIVEDYLKEHPSFNLRLQVKAGLTGYAQLYGRYNSEPVDKLKMDLFYINNMSLFFDLKMIILTVKILFQKESTESVEEGRVTAKK